MNPCVLEVSTARNLHCIVPAKICDAVIAPSYWHAGSITVVEPFKSNGSSCGTELKQLFSGYVLLPISGFGQVMVPMHADVPMGATAGPAEQAAIVERFEGYRRNVTAFKLVR